VLGNSATASQYSIAIGGGDSAATGARVGTAAGTGAVAAIAIGRNAVVNDGANNGIAMGTNSLAGGIDAIAIGTNSSAIERNSSAFGSGASATADSSVALGAGSVANRANSVSVGSAGAERQVTNVAAATQDTDATNLSQLKQVAGALGGGANVNGGVFTAPTYTIQGTSHNNVGSAFGGVDAELTGIKTSITGLAASGVQYDDASKATTTLQGAAGTQIRNLANGVAASDAVNKGQLDAGDAATLSSANTYTDTRETAIRTDVAAGDAATLQSANSHTNARETAVRSDFTAADAATLASARTHTDIAATRTLTSANAYTDQKIQTLSLDFTGFRGQVNDRFERTDTRINQVGAMGAAMANMTASAAGVRTQNRVAVGYGNYGGENAFAFGYQRAISDRAVITFGSAINGDQTAVGAGAALGW